MCLHVARLLVSTLHLLIHSLSICVLHHCLSIDLGGCSFESMSAGCWLQSYWPRKGTLWSPENRGHVKVVNALRSARHISILSGQLRSCGMKDAKIDVSTLELSAVSMKQSCVCGQIRNTLDRDRVSAKFSDYVVLWSLYEFCIPNILLPLATTLPSRCKAFLASRA